LPGAYSPQKEFRPPTRRNASHPKVDVLRRSYASEHASFNDTDTNLMQGPRSQRLHNRRRKHTEIWRGVGSPYSGLMLAARITWPHFSVSFAKNVPNSAGELANGVLPRSASRPLIVGSVRAALISRLSLSTISAGVLLGPPTPVKEIA
jgi:hypothetical protein